jgi:hypothetical protein
VAQSPVEAPRTRVPAEPRAMLLHLVIGHMQRYRCKPSRPELVLRDCCFGTMHGSPIDATSREVLHLPRHAAPHTQQRHQLELTDQLARATSWSFSSFCSSALTLTHTPFLENVVANEVHPACCDSSARAVARQSCCFWRR